MTIDAFDVIKTIEYRALKAGAALRRRQNSALEGVLMVPQYPHAHSVLNQPDVEAPPEAGVTCAVPSELPVTQDDLDFFYLRKEARHIASPDLLVPPE